MMEAETCKILNVIENKICDLETLSGKEISSQHLSDIFAEEFQRESETVPVISTMGVSFPLANNVFALDCRRHLSANPELDKKLRKIAEDAAPLDVKGDLSYKRHDPEFTDYIFQLDGFYISGRRGKLPSPVFKLLRAPYQRTVLEQIVWVAHDQHRSRFPELYPDQSCCPKQEREWLEEQTKKKEIKQYFRQVFMHARPLCYVQRKFHPDLPFVSDPETGNEYSFLWIGFKPLEKYFQIPIDKIYQNFIQAQKTNRITSTNSVSSPKIQTSFKLSDFYAEKADFASATPSRRKEKKLALFFSVSPEWDRTCVFDKSKTDIYIWNHRLEDRYEEILGLSLPQEVIFEMILMTCNPVMRYKAESAKRGLTNWKTLIKAWQRWMKCQCLK
jgi:hypothetical protein